MPTFIPGLELSRRFYQDAVAPILAEACPSLPYAAALLGPGSDVLGFDTPMSTDHDWGPRLLLFLRDEDAGQVDAVRDALRRRLPRVFAGYPVGTRKAPDEGPVEHRVRVTTVRAW